MRFLYGPRFLTLGGPAIASYSDLVILLWMAVSIVVLLRLRVFAAGPLRAAPPRTSSLTLLHFAAAILLYLSFAVVAGSVAAQMDRTAGGAATATASASAPASATRAASASATATASATALADRINVYNPRQRIADDVARLLTAASIAMMASVSVVGGLAGFGLGVRDLRRGVLAGLIALLLMLPILTLLQVGAEALRQMLAPPSGPPIHRFLQMLRSDETPAYARVLIAVSAGVVAPLAEEFLFRGLLQTIIIGTAVQLRERRWVMVFGYAMFLTAMWNVGVVFASKRVEVAALLPRMVIDFVVFAAITAAVWFAYEYAQKARGATIRWFAIVLASVLFAAIHWDPAIGNWTHFPVLFLLSVSLGYLYERTGTLWAPIVMHAGFNGVTLVLTVAGAAK